MTIIDTLLDRTDDWPLAWRRAYVAAFPLMAPLLLLTRALIVAMSVGVLMVGLLVETLAGLWSDDHFRN